MRKKILITDGSGFLGRNLALKLKNDYDVILGSRNGKNNMVASKITGCQSIALDVSNIESVRDVIGEINPDIIIHGAATKFVDLSEKYPMETIDINVIGSQNIVRVSIEKKIGVVIGISTDKACPPVRNIYGMSKSLMEKMFTLMNGKSITKFSVVRYGNVAWSTGSVLPIWDSMHKEKNVIGTTGPDMRRFFFTVENAVELVINCMDNINICAGKIFSREMKSAQIRDILDVWIEMYGGSWNRIDGRPGERNDEYLVGETELDYCKTIDINGVKHFIISPNDRVNRPLTNIFTSENADRLSKEEIVGIIKSGKDV